MFKELIMNHLSSFSDPLILLLCSFHTMLNWITASFFTISSYSWPSLYQVWKHYHCLRFRDAAEDCITSQSVQKYFDVILLLDIEEQLSKWRMVFHFVITMSHNAACLFYTICIVSFYYISFSVFLILIKWILSLCLPVFLLACTRRTERSSNA